MDLTMKELRLHTLRGDIQQCGMDGMNEQGIRRLLKARYADLPEFEETLAREYAKVEAWRAEQK
jgi:hypothetical protein